MVNWDHTADKRLLAAIYTACGGTFDWEKAGKEFGPDCSGEAVKQHIRSLRIKGGPNFGAAVTGSPVKATAASSAGVSKHKRANTSGNSPSGKSASPKSARSKSAPSQSTPSKAENPSSEGE